MMCSSLFAMQICTVHQLCQLDSVINQSSGNPLSDWQLRFQSASWLTTWVHILKTGYDNLDMIWTIWKFLLSVTLNESLNLHFMRKGRVGGARGARYSEITPVRQNCRSHEMQQLKVIEETVSSLLHFCVLHPPGLSAADKAKKENTTGPTGFLRPWTLMLQSRSESLASETYQMQGFYGRRPGRSVQQDTILAGSMDNIVSTRTILSMHAGPNPRCDDIGRSDQVSCWCSPCPIAR